MIDPGAIRAMANRFQTTADNVVREYFQHLFLSHLYREKKADQWLFKGGTALRIIWRSPRFSEDLDFTGIRLSASSAEHLLGKVTTSLEQEGLRVVSEEGKPTSGGYLAILRLEGGEYRARIQLQVSFRTSGKEIGSALLIASDLVPPYSLMHLEIPILVREKINALLTRAKPRDFYDLYFILRQRLGFAEVFQFDKSLKPRLVDAISRSRLDAKSELKRFLPVNQHNLLKDFLSVLRSEVERSLP